MSELAQEIEALKTEKNAVILAHNYQRPEVQDIADYIGDSYGLSVKASQTEADTIVFCGVDFMAETAKILNPGKKVLMPAEWALCPMAMLLHPQEIIDARKEHPDAQVVLYINTHAEAKALSDCICTSANALKVIDSMESDDVIFGPDRNLAGYVKKNTKKNIILVPENGLCPTHHMIQVQDVKKAINAHPDAEVIVHPETIPEVQELADYIGSTTQMMRYCKESKSEDFIIGTEVGLIYRLEKETNGKRYYPASEMAYCNTMKMITLKHVKDALIEGKHEVKVPEDVAAKSLTAIQRMIDTK
ncbi:quinolinate synthase NadA [Candidatus Altiarchaeota archaeon]